MKPTLTTVLVLAGALSLALPCLAQAPRKDVIWARSTGGAPITLDGALNEPAWAAAESVIVRYGIDTGIPGSGWKPEAGILPVDPTYATLRFLTVGNQLYMGAVVRDRSVGGSKDFNRFDGFLMSIKDHANANRPSPPSEYLYSWWYETDTPPNDTAPGKMPSFRGRWSQCSVSPPQSCYWPRTAEQIANWDAVTVVNGLSNDDSSDDVGYTVEMRFNLTAEGYDVTKPQGDVVEWNISIYDCDWLWPFQGIFSANRVWWQNPWGNVAWYHNVRIHARPNVTVSSGPVPTLGPEIRIPAADGFPAPTIDGSLTETVWQRAPAFDIRYGDAALRATYPGVGPWRSGQYQPPVNGGLAAILDPADCTVRWFFKGDILYLGFDVRDQVVQYHSLFDRWDGFLVSLNEYSMRGPDQQLLGRRLSFQVGPTGQALAHDYLPFLRDTLGGAQLALQLKPGTTVDTLGTSPDVGYTAELSIDLKKLGYPAGRGDGRIFLGINHLDGDSFIPFTDSYGQRVWWQREYEGSDGPAWGYLDPAQQVVGVESVIGPAGEIALLGNRPNPFRGKTSIHFRLAQERDVSLEVFDLLGRRVATQAYGRRPAGPGHLVFQGDGLDSGLYLYRLRLGEGADGADVALSGKMLLVR